MKIFIPENKIFLIFTRCLLILFFSFTVHSFAAELSKSIHPNIPIRSLVLKQWTAEDGLISNNLTAVSLDQAGFIWITCFNGALKFDGNTFQLYDRENLPFLNSNAFMNLFNGRDGTILFSSQASGIILYNQGSFIHPEFNVDIPKNIRSVYVTEEDVIWVGSNNSGLYYIKNNEVVHDDNPLVSDVTIMDIAGDNQGRIYVATYKNGMIVIDNNLYRQYDIRDGLFSNDINTIHISEDDRIYIGTTLGLNIMKDRSVSETNYYENIEINEIIQDGYGSIWLATETGLGRINPLYHTYEFFNTQDGLPTRQISDLIFDHEGNLWLCTKKGGLIRLKLGNFVNYTQKDGLALDQVNIIEEKEPGIYYVGTDDGAINIISDNKINDFTLNTDLHQNGIRDICFVNDNELWIASYQGILIKNYIGEKLLNRDTGLPAHDIRSIRKDSHDNIWVATRSGGLIKFVNHKLVEVYNKNNGLGSNYVLCIEEDLDHSIWVGTNGGGLCKIDIHGNINTYSISNDPSGILYFNIDIDENNIKWLATNVGIFRFDDQNFLEIKLSSTSQNDTFFDIIFDDFDGIWFTSNIGLNRIKKQDLNNFLDGKIESVPTTIFDHDDGLKNKECTGATRSLKSSDGRLWIPTLGGVAIIDPEYIKENRTIPPVYITDFLTDRSGEFISEALISGNLTLEPGKFRYKIKFTALSYQAPNKVRFRYKLENIDEEWIENVNIREVQYTHLPPGRYNFQVLASNNDNYWNETGASLSFRIKPFFFQRIGVYVTGIVLAIIITWIAYKRRIRVIEKRNKELERVNEELDKFVYSASHDLKAPLNSVLGLINIAKKDGPSGNIPLYLEMVEKSIKKLERFIGDIIDYSRNSSVSLRISKIDFNQLVNEAWDEVKYLKQKDGITNEISIRGDGEFFSDETRISVVLNNLLSNAINYHDPGKEKRYIKILINYSASKAEIIVEDNGTGISVEHQNKIFKMFYRAREDSKGSGLGLYIVKETLNKIHGSIHLYSKPREGSRFTITIPSINSKKR